MPENIDILVSGDGGPTSERFILNRGVTQKQVLHLIELAGSDTEVRAQTSDPKRFAGRSELERWLAKRRIIYTLTDDADELCGVAWFGEEKMPIRTPIEDYNPEDYGVTFAIRTYGKARGKGVAGGLLSGAIKDVVTRDWYGKLQNNGIWLETSDSNAPAKKLYEKTGWTRVSDPDEKGRILMIHKGE